MPGSPTNTQTNQATVSNNGTDIRSALQPKSHFLLDGGVNFTQAESGRFGVVSSSQFRTTSVFDFSGDANIYAICRGQVFLQPNAEDPTNKINLILRPFNQPINELPIKYFVYRGLKKSDFIEDNAIKANGNTSSEFINYINEEFLKFYDNEAEETENPISVPSFLAEFVGYSEDNTSEYLAQHIDDFFFKISRTFEEEVLETGQVDRAFEFPMINSGMQLGTATGSVGLDIVLSDGDYYIENDPNPFQLDLHFARAGVHILDTANGTTDYEKKLILEACTRFLDPAAFYGMHANANNVKGGELKVRTADTTNTLTTPQEVSDLLISLQTFSKHYLYIQSNRQRSYNFYGNYSHSNQTVTTNLQHGSSVENLTPETFGTNGWPLHVLEANPHLFLQLFTDNYAEATLYAFTGYIVSAHEDNFVRGENLLQTPSEDEDNPVDTNYTKPQHFSFPVDDDGVALPCFIQLIYEGAQLEISATTDAVTEGEPVFALYLKDIDDVFGLLNAQSYIKTKHPEELSTVAEHTLSMINFPNAQRSKDIALVKTKRIQDQIPSLPDEYLQRVTYETQLHGIRQVQNSYIPSANAMPDSSSSRTGHYTQNFYKPEKPYYLKTQVFTANNQTVTGLSLETTQGSLSTKKLLGLTQAENDRIKAVAVTLNNPKIYLKNTSYNENDVYTSPENIEYKMYEVLIIGENAEGEPQLYQPTNAEGETEYAPIIVYSIDGFVFASHTYAKYTPELFKGDYNFLISKFYNL